MEAEAVTPPRKPHSEVTTPPKLPPVLKLPCGTAQVVGVDDDGKTATLKMSLPNGGNRGLFECFDKFVEKLTVHTSSAPGAKPKDVLWQRPAWKPAERGLHDGRNLLDYRTMIGVTFCMNPNQFVARDH
ncbi:rpsF [Symbiodinium sp. KB8]|nr:rpsF [Symbiodinium sp. KB8]